MTGGEGEIIFNKCTWSPYRRHRRNHRKIIEIIEKIFGAFTIFTISETLHCRYSSKWIETITESLIVNGYPKTFIERTKEKLIGQSLKDFCSTILLLHRHPCLRSIYKEDVTYFFFPQPSLFSSSYHIWWLQYHYYHYFIIIKNAPHSSGLGTGLDWRWLASPKAGLYELKFNQFKIQCVFYPYLENG